MNISRLDNREIPLVIATNMTLFNRYGIDSAYCVDYDINNNAFSTQGIMLVTDAFTSGASLCTALEEVKERTSKYPSDVVICVDRMEDADRSVLSAKHEIENRYGIHLNNVVAFGDDLNDIEMLKIACISVASGNANGEVNAVADYVTGCNDEDGVSRWINRYVLNDPVTAQH